MSIDFLLKKHYWIGIYENYIPKLCSMKKESLLLQYLGDTPELRIVDFFLDNKGSDYSKEEVMEFTNISKITFDKVWYEMQQFGSLKETQKYEKIQLYMLNDDDKLISKLKSLDDELAERAMQKALEKPIT